MCVCVFLCVYTPVFVRICPPAGRAYLCKASLLSLLVSHSSFLLICASRCVCVYFCVYACVYVHDYVCMSVSIRYVPVSLTFSLPQNNMTILLFFNLCSLYYLLGVCACVEECVWLLYPFSEDLALTLWSI